MVWLMQYLLVLHVNIVDTAVSGSEYCMIVQKLKYERVMMYCIA